MTFLVEQIPFARRKKKKKKKDGVKGIKIETKKKGKKMKMKGRAASQSNAKGMGPGFIAFKTRNGDDSGHPRFALFSLPLWVLPAPSDCHAGTPALLHR